MALPKKPSDKTTIRRLRKELRNASIDVAKWMTRANQYEAQLLEARRRTAAIRGGGSLNFLPLAITSINRKQPIRTAQSADGSMYEIVGNAEVTIVVNGDVVQHVD